MFMLVFARVFVPLGCTGIIAVAPSTLKKFGGDVSVNLASAFLLLVAAPLTPHPIDQREQRASKKALKKIGA
jgi:hypothetical protein